MEKRVKLYCVVGKLDDLKDKAEYKEDVIEVYAKETGKCFILEDRVQLTSRLPKENINKIDSILKNEPTSGRISFHIFTTEDGVKDAKERIYKHIAHIVTEARLNINRKLEAIFSHENVIFLK